MYYQYWGLTKPPFDNVPDPSMYVDSHTSMENAIAETLFAIEEGNECVAVIVGDVGLGKTLSLRLIIDSLEQDKYRIALITNPGITFVQLIKEIIGQLTGKQCQETKKIDLLETFNRILFATIDEGKKVLIFIDEGNAISPANLESLRLLTNMQDDERNLFTLVLAGQIELARRLEHPKRANLFQRIGTYSRIDKIETIELLRAYVEKRLMLAGGKRKIFTDDAFAPLWEYSEYGVPRLINKICKLSLKAGETNHFDCIDAFVLDQIGQRFRRLTGSAIQKRKPRKRDTEQVVQEQVQHDEVVGGDKVPIRPARVSEEPLPVKQSGVAVEKVSIKQDILHASGENREQDKLLKSDGDSAIVPVPNRGNGMQAQPVREKQAETGFGDRQTTSGNAQSNDSVEMKIGGEKFSLYLPSSILRKARATTPENRIKLAGALAAHALRKNPQLISSHLADPVHIWGEIRAFVLNILGEEKMVNAM